MHTLFSVTAYATVLIQFCTYIYICIMLYVSEYMCTCLNKFKQCMYVFICTYINMNINLITGDAFADGLLIDSTLENYALTKGAFTAIMFITRYNSKLQSVHVCDCTQTAHTCESIGTSLTHNTLLYLCRS